ncbi:MAG: hypothetical protein HY094_08900 [Candidatus Melainabacteria bacterium]|nr:hypothetical protein [Candidatus Melainabacteria bacterium]
MDTRIIKKLLTLIFSFSSAVCLSIPFSFAADFIVPNSSGEPVVIDVSNLNLISDIDVTVGDFVNQPRPYRDSNTKSLVVFPLPASNAERTIQIHAGSSSISKTISFRPSPQGVLKDSLLPGLQEARAGNTATKISDGRVVLIGGSKALADSPISTVEIFDPETGKSGYLKTSNGLKNLSLQIPRSQHSATYLGISNLPVGMISGPVEQILLAGGFSKNGQLENTLEIVEINVGTTQSVSTLLDSKKTRLKKARIFHTASLLPDGRVLIIGGQGNINMTTIGALNSIEIFEPGSRLVQPSGISLNTPRLLHTATTLQNGNILITGGFTNEKQDQFGFGPATNISELIDVTSLTIKKVGSLVEKGVGGHSATLLTNGLVLITGGSTDFFAGRTQDVSKGLAKGTIQFYNSTSETFDFVLKSSGGNLELQNPRFLHESILLPDGSVAVVGGLNIKEGLNSTSIISNPVSTIEIFKPDITAFAGSSLKSEQKSNLETSIGRILPTVVLVTPKNKTQGFLSTQDSGNFINSAAYITGGFTNGLGKLPTKVSELIHIQSKDSIEGRQLILTPEGLIRGSFLGQLLIELDKFTKVPALQVKPQTINLSAANNFKATVKVSSTNDEIVLLKPDSLDPNNPIIVSPSLFQTGEEISISKKDNSIQGQFEINFIPADSTKDFVQAKVKVNVSDSSKPFLATIPGFGISLSNEEGETTEKIQLKVLSQDGSTEFSSVPQDTQVTATINDPTIANLGDTGISSVVGTLATQFTVNAIKPGKTKLNFTINFPDVLPVSIPLEVSGTPSFSSTPIDATVLSGLISSGLELSDIKKLSSTTVSIEDIALSSDSPLFPIYVPINLQSSVDNSLLTGLFTIRPIFAIDLQTALPRTLVNNKGTGFRSPLSTEPLSVGGIVPSDTSVKPIVVFASDDGLRTLNYGISISENIDAPLNMLSTVSGVSDLKLFEFGSDSKSVKISALKENMILVLDVDSGNVETSVNLSGTGFEQKLLKIDDQTASAVSLGGKGVDLVFPITDAEPRIVNFKLPGNTRNISVIPKLANVAGPFLIAYDGASTVSIVNLLDVNAPIQTIDTEGNKISMLDYAGRFPVNGKTTDVAIAATQRNVLLYDLNNLTSISVNDKLKIESKIEDLLVIDGIAYLALGTNGISALSIGALINSNSDTPAEIAHFKKNKLTVIKSNGTPTIVTRLLSASKLADSKPFLLSTGAGNNLTVIRVSP